MAAVDIHTVSCHKTSLFQCYVILFDNTKLSIDVSKGCASKF